MLKGKFHAEFGKNIFWLLIITLCLPVFISTSWAGDGDKKWEFPTGDPMLSSPAIGKDGTIYVGSHDNKLYAINPDGTKKWEFITGDDIRSFPAIGGDGTIYVGSWDNRLYAINPDGTKKWHFNTGGDVDSSPAIGADGTIYIGSWDRKLYAINPNGTKKWEFSTGAFIYGSSPAIDGDGTVYVGSHDNNLYAINPDGTRKWEYNTGGEVFSSPAIGTDGTIYVGSRGNNFYAINPDGTKKWEFVTGGPVFSSPAIESDGTVYFGSLDHNLYAINPDGTKKWDFLTGDTVYCSPAIGLDGTIYVGSSDFKLHAINPDGTRKWEFATGGFVESSPAIGNDGTVYAGSKDSKLYAIETDCGGLADSPWPMFHHDTQHTGNTGRIWQYHLKAGWNLISFRENKCFYSGLPPVDQPACVEMVDIASLGFNSLAEWFGSCLTPDNPTYDVWRMVMGANGAMDNSLPSTFHSLKYMSCISGYWVKISEAAGGATLTLTGEAFDLDCDIILTKGWNLVSYPSNIAFYDTDIPPAVDVPSGTIWKKVPPPVAAYVFQSLVYTMIIGSSGVYNPLLDPPFSSLHYVVPGDAFWVKVKVNIELNYPKE